MNLFGFTAHPFMDGKSEFGVIFHSPEGRARQVEGRLSRLNIEKFSQLERNLQEDPVVRKQTHMLTEYYLGTLRLTALASAGVVAGKCSRISEFAPRS